MKIGIDAHVIGKKKTGAEVYCKNLIRELAHLDSENQYQVFLSPSGADFSRLHNDNNHFNFKTIKTRNLLFQRFISLPWETSRNNLDILHTQRVVPLFCSAKTIVTIYDIAHQIYPSFFSRKDRLAMRSLIPFSAKRADRIITCSETTKKDLINYYHIPEAKIAVIPLAVDLRKYNPLVEPELIRKIRQKYKITLPFILFTGAIEPRKNLICLVKAFAKLKKLLSSDYLLVISGTERDENHGYSKKLRESISSLGLENKVMFLGYLPDEDIPLLYKAAEVFVYPSLLEGFGLPPLEAMACGTATVVSSIPSLLEVVGDSALKVNPNNVDGFAQAIYQLINNTNRRQQLEKEGRKRAELFSWRETARKTLLLYQDLFRS